MTDNQQTRVVVTGIGWVTPLGHDLETVWDGLLAGKSAIRPTEHFDASTFPTTFSAQVGKDYDYRQFVKYPEIHESISPNTQFALGASAQAWNMANFSPSAPPDPDRVGIYLGSGEGTLDFDSYVGANMASWDASKRSIDSVKWAALALERFTAIREIEQEPNMPASHLAMEFDACGPTYNCLTACAASTQAIGEATAALRKGDADVMITGGAHTMIHPLGVTGFNRLTALSERNDDHTTASRPFSQDRDGFVLGEGAGIVILETLEHATARGADILAEIIGFGSSADAYRITDIQPQGRGACESMTQAMEQAKEIAGVELADVDYISAHGTGTKENDSIETKAVKIMFAGVTQGLAMSSIKSMMGHLIAAAGAVELITCILAIRDGKLPPTINLHTPDPDCDLDYVANVSRDAKVDVALSNSFGFGGQNNTVAIKRF